MIHKKFWIYQGFHKKQNEIKIENINKMSIYICMLFIFFTASVTNGLFLESSGTPLDTRQLATSMLNSNSGSLSEPQTSLHPSTSILSASHDTILETSSANPMKNTQKLTASKTESLQNSHARTQLKESTVLATKLSTAAITMTTPTATSSKTLSSSATVFNPTSIQPTSSLKMADSSTKSLESDIPKALVSLRHSVMLIASSTMVNSTKLDAIETSSESSTMVNSTKLDIIETSSESSTMATTVPHQHLSSSLGSDSVTSDSSAPLENNSKTKLMHLTSVSHLQSSTPATFHQTQSSDSVQSVSTRSRSTISVENTRQMVESSQIMKSSNVIVSDSAQWLSTTIQPSQNSPMPSSKPLDVETSSYFDGVITTSRINGTKILADSILKMSVSSPRNSDEYSMSATPVIETLSQSSFPSTSNLGQNLELITPSPTRQILNTKLNNTESLSVFPSSSIFGNTNGTVYQPASSFSADMMKMYSHSSTELSSPLMTTGIIASTISASILSANISDSHLSSTSSLEIQETVFPSSSTPTIWFSGNETLVSSNTENKTLPVLISSAVHQKDMTLTSTSTIMSQTESFLIPTIPIEPTKISSTSSKAYTPHSKTISSSSSEKTKHHSMMLNELPTNPTTTHIVHTTETMYYPTRRTPQKYNATIELTFNGKCEPLHIRRTYEHFVDNVQTLISKRLRVAHEHVIVHNLTCASVHIHVTFLNITTANLTGRLQDLINRNKMNVTVYGNRQELHYQGTALKLVPFPKSITEILMRSKEKNTEVVVIIIASAIIVLLVMVGLIVFGRECYRRKRSQTFDLTNTPHVHLKMEDFTLTRIPRTGAWYSDEGVTIQRFSETNGNSIIKSSNGVRKQPAISCISDMLREKENHGAQLRQFSYTILPSNRKDSQDTTVSTASDGNFRHSTDSLVARQNSNMHGAVNPIYLGDEFPRLLPSAHTDQRSDFVNGGQRRN